MAKFIPAEDIPADIEAIAFWEDSHGNTQWQMSKSIRGAKLIVAKHTDSPKRGWSAIDGAERTHGKMIW